MNRSRDIAPCFSCWSAVGVLYLIVILAKTL